MLPTGATAGGRQYRAFAGVAHGRHTHRFFERLIDGGFATTDLAAPAHAGRIYHLQYKPCAGCWVNPIIRTAGRPPGILGRRAILWFLVVVAVAPGVARAQRLRPLPPAAGPSLSRADQHARHAQLWAGCRACREDGASAADDAAASGAADPSALQEAPPMNARQALSARSGEAAGRPESPRRVSPYVEQSVTGLPAVAIVDVRIGEASGHATGDGRGVFTDYECVVERVRQNSVLQPVTRGATLLVTRPGGSLLQQGARRMVPVSGYPALVRGARVTLTLVAIPDAGSFQEVSLRAVAEQERP